MYLEFGRFQLALDLPERRLEIDHAHISAAQHIVFQFLLVTGQNYRFDLRRVDTDFPHHHSSTLSFPEEPLVRDHSVISQTIFVYQTGS